MICTHICDEISCRSTLEWSIDLATWPLSRLVNALSTVPPDIGTDLFRGSEDTPLLVLNHEQYPYYGLWCSDVSRMNILKSTMLIMSCACSKNATTNIWTCTAQNLLHVLLFFTRHSHCFPTYHWMTNLTVLMCLINDYYYSINDRRMAHQIFNIKMVPKTILKNVGARLSFTHPLHH